MCPFPRSCCFPLAQSTRSGFTFLSGHLHHLLSKCQLMGGWRTPGDCEVSPIHWRKSAKQEKGTKRNRPRTSRGLSFRGRTGERRASSGGPGLSFTFLTFLLCEGREILQETRVRPFSAELLLPAKRMVHGESALGTCWSKRLLNFCKSTWVPKLWSRSLLLILQSIASPLFITSKSTFRPKDLAMTCRNMARGLLSGRLDLREPREGPQAKIKTDSPRGTPRGLSGQSGVSPKPRVIWNQLSHSHGLCS